MMTLRRRIGAREGVNREVGWGGIEARHEVDMEGFKIRRLNDARKSYLRQTLQGRDNRSRGVEVRC